MTDRASEPARERERALPAQGPRTTLRVPEHLAETATRLAEELGTSRNDALIRLATRGADAYQREARIASRREERWAAVLGDISRFDRADFPPEDEAHQATMAFRREALEPRSER
jgi:hypothetical protein